MTPLPIRANNPLSLVFNPTTKYQGLADPPNLEHLFNFLSPQYGVRAATLNLAAYKKRGLATIAQIIPVWSPKAAGNPTEKYVSDVQEWSGIARDKVLTPTDTEPLFMAMSRQEDGTSLDLSVIREGIAMAQPTGVMNAVQAHVASNAKVYGGGGLGGMIAAFLIGELQQRFHLTLTTMELTAIPIACTFLVAQLFPKGVPTPPG